MRISYILLFLFVNIIGYGQQLPAITPPSPEAAQLAKFVDMPVSLYNGTANISVPLYTINSGGIQIPISLSYHSKGIQVGEKASRVGLGWVLNAGGAITRQVRGKVDEFPNGYYTTNYASDFTTNSSKRRGLWSDDANGLADFDPDLFMFNFLGYSGKFIMDHVTKEVVLQSYSDLKIEKFGQGGYNYDQSFVVTTPEGVRFYFSTKDYTHVRNTYRFNASSQGHEPLGNLSDRHIEAWYLDKIITASNEIIDFTYELEEVYYNDITEINRTIGGTKFVTYTTTHTYQNQLKQITFNEGKVLFNATEDRQDLKGGKTLDQIWIYAKKDVSNNVFETTKRIRFNHYYTTSDDNNLQTVLPLLKLNNHMDSQITYYDTKRLFLGYVEEIDVLNSNKTIKTSFEYNPVLLPNRLSNATDNWGYFNSKNNHYLNVFLETDRTVSEVNSEAGILKKINHPSGGSTEFIYEQNKVIPAAYFKDLLIAYNNPFSPKTVGIFKNPTLYNPAKNSYYQTFELKRKSIVSFNVEFSTEGCTVGGPAEATCKYDVFITDESGEVPLVQLVLGDQNFIELFSGIYKIKVVPRYGQHNPNDFEQFPFQIIGRWQEQDIPDNQELLAAGKRIKEIIKTDNGGNTVQKRFYYIDEQGICSGRTFSIPAFYQLTAAGYGLGGTELTNGGSAPLRNFAGNNLGYSVVTEVQSGNGDIGKTINKFTNFENQGDYYRVPYHLPIDLEWARGLPTAINHYKFDNGSYILLNKTLNTYAFYDLCASPGINPFECLVDLDNPPLLPSYILNTTRVKIPLFRFGGYLDGATPSCNIISPDCYRTSYFIGGKFNLSQKEEFNYFDSGVVYTKTYFKHEGNNHLQLTKQIFTNSDGESIETKYSYAPDISTTINDSLVGKNMVGIPLKTEVKKNGQLLSIQETVYKNWGNNLLAPELIKTSKENLSPEVRVKYNLVDNTNGNPLEVQQESGIPISYIWGYNNSQPVAKLENISYPSIPANHIQAIESASNNNDEAGLIAAFTALRNDPSLANAMITTYTYKPLVGVSSVTDPKGNKITYHYDGLGRLEFVKDQEGNILSESKYHYRTQN